MKVIQLSSCLLLILIVGLTDALKRCYECRSRGVLGDCGDPFNTNTSSISSSVTVTTCPSGWCGKMEDEKEEKNPRTERMCLPQAPSDNEERCGETNWESKKVYMCFCDGDLCNASSALSSHTFISIVSLLFFILTW